GRGAPASVRRPDSGRHVSQPRRPRRLFGTDVQAHTRAGLAAELPLRIAELPGSHERRHWHDPGRVSEELGETRAAGYRHPYRGDRRVVARHAPLTLREP